MAESFDPQTLILFLQLVLTVVMSVVGAHLKALRVEIEALRNEVRGVLRRVERLEDELIRRGVNVSIDDLR